MNRDAAIGQIFLALHMLIFKAKKDYIFHSSLQNSPMNGLKQLEREQNEKRSLFLLLNMATYVNAKKICPIAVWRNLQGDKISK